MNMSKRVDMIIMEAEAIDHDIHMDNVVDMGHEAMDLVFLDNIALLSIQEVHLQWNRRLAGLKEEQHMPNSTGLNHLIDLLHHLVKCIMGHILIHPVCMIVDSLQLL